MEKIQNNATVVACENPNVAVETTSINHLNSDQMEEKKVIATDVANEDVANATSENLNAAEDAASINNLQSTDMIEKDEEKVVHPTRLAVIDGKETEIVVAHTEYDMELPKDKRNLMDKVDKTKLFKCYFHLAKPQIFWEEGVLLIDENGNIVEEGTDNVYVFCPTAGTSWRLVIEEVLRDVEIHDFNSVQDYAQAVGCTNLYSRGLSNIEKMGVAALATGDEACKTVFDFAKANKLTVTTAKLYLDYRVKPTDIQSMTMGMMEEARPELGRTKEEAQELLDQATEKFGKNAQKRYVIRAVNSLLHTDDCYSLEQVKEAIRMVTEAEVDSIKAANSAEKESIISSKLTKWLLKDQKLEDAA